MSTPARARRILARLPLFIPMFDQMVLRYGIMTAAVYGVVWRQCQMGERLCRIPVCRVANVVGANPITVTKSLRRLVEQGWVEDVTPHIGRHPHAYRVTGRFHTSVELHVIDEYPRLEAA